MLSIKELIQFLNTKEREKEFLALKALDNNILELLSRIEKLELRNLRYYCRAYRATTYVSPTGMSLVPLTNTEYPQFGNMHDNTNDNTKIFIRRTGIYYLSGSAQFAASALGTFRQVAIILNRGGVASVLVSQRVPNANVIITPSVSCSYYLYEGDSIELQVNQDTGGNLDVPANYPQSPFLAVSERREDLDPSQYGLLNPEANMR